MLKNKVNQILIIDKEPSIHESLKAIFLDDELSIDSAFTPEEAIIKIQKNNYQQIICEYAFPSLQGMDVISLIKLFGFTGVISLLTSDAEIINNKDNFLKAGFQVWEKPIENIFNFKNSITKNRELAPLS